MAENMQVSGRQRREPLIVRCCLKKTVSENVIFAEKNVRLAVAYAHKVTLFSFFDIFSVQFYIRNLK